GESADHEAARRGAADGGVDRRGRALDFHRDGVAAAGFGGIARRRGLVAAAGVKLWGWGLAAALAAGFLAALAFHGERPQTALERFEPAGLLVGWPLEDVAAIEISAGSEHRAFRRVAGAGWDGEGGARAANPQRIATGL